MRNLGLFSTNRLSGKQYINHQTKKMPTTAIEATSGWPNASAGEEPTSSVSEDTSIHFVEVSSLDKNEGLCESLMPQVSQHLCLGVLAIQKGVGGCPE